MACSGRNAATRDSLSYESKLKSFLNLWAPSIGKSKANSHRAVSLSMERCGQPGGLLLPDHCVPQGASTVCDPCQVVGFARVWRGLLQRCT